MDDRQSWKIESKSLFDIGPRFGGSFLSRFCQKIIT